MVLGQIQCWEAWSSLTFSNCSTPISWTNRYEWAKHLKWTNEHFTERTGELTSNDLTGMRKNAEWNCIRMRCIRLYHMYFLTCPRPGKHAQVEPHAGHPTRHWLASLQGMAPAIENGNNKLRRHGVEKAARKRAQKFARNAVETIGCSLSCISYRVLSVLTAVLNRSEAIWAPSILDVTVNLRVGLDSREARSRNPNLPANLNVEVPSRFQTGGKGRSHTLHHVACVTGNVSS